DALENAEIALVDNIDNQQSSIIKNGEKVLGEEEFEDLKEAFLEKEELKGKTIDSLASYSNELSKLSNRVEENLNIDERLVKELLEHENVQEEIDTLYRLDEEVNIGLQSMFDDLLGPEKDEFREDEDVQQGEIEQLQEKFDGMVE